MKEVPPKLMNALEQQFLVIAEAFDTQGKAVAQGFTHQNKEISKLHGQLWDVATGMEKLNEQNTQITQQQVAAEQRLAQQQGDVEQRILQHQAKAEERAAADTNRDSGIPQCQKCCAYLSCRRHLRCGGSQCFSNSEDAA